MKPIDKYRIEKFTTTIASLPDKIIGRAQWLKEQFDAQPKQIQQAFNALLDGLARDAGESGAALIGAVDKDGTPTTVQAQILGAITEEKVSKMIQDAVFATGAADMAKAVYDTKNRGVDIYQYTDDAIKQSVTDALNGGV